MLTHVYIPCENPETIRTYCTQAGRRIKAEQVDVHDLIIEVDRPEGEQPRFCMWKVVTTGEFHHECVTVWRNVPLYKIGVVISHSNKRLHPVIRATVLAAFSKGII